EAAGRLVPRRGMVVLISDLLMDAPEVVRVVRTLRRAGHQVTVLQIIDPAERELPFASDAVFVDPESGDEVPAAVADVRTAYRATVAEALEEWRSTLAAVGAAHEVVATDAPFGVPLRRAFAARQRIP
ncbi:MAG TPA: hypothetical protein VFS05_02185, partial [Gemmatimonadaceae bacterium]|nr:hypothetical protein [Gemmatimonadaceae bacterium]